MSAKKPWYAIVTFGGSVPGRTVFRTRKEAEERAALLRCEGKQHGRWKCDDAVLASIQIRECPTREAAKKANIGK